MSDIVDIAASTLDERTNTLMVQCKSAPMGDSEEDAPDFGAMSLYGVGGVTCRPAPKDDRGNAQAIVDEGLPGASGVCVAWRDTRCSSVVAELGPGESCLHSTGKDYDSRFFAKDQLAAIVVGDDCAVVMDRKNKKFSISCFGLHLEMSEASGFVVSDGAGTIQLKDGIIRLLGTVVLGGASPMFPVQCGPAPVIGGVGGASNPAPGVFIGG